MALATKFIGGIAAASYLAYRAFRKLREQAPEVQAETIRTARWVAGIMMATCKFVYEVVGVFMGSRIQTQQQQSGSPNGGSPHRFSRTAADHEADEAA